MRALAALVSLSVVFTAACGSGGTAPSAPVVPTGPAFNEVRVGVAGNGPTLIEPGKTAQLFAQAVMSDGTTQDVTNVAAWESSNAAVATVSATGLVTTRTEGDVNITATFVKTGTLGLRVKIDDCRYTFNPEMSTFSPFAQANASVQVVGSKPTCSWTLSEGASWIRLLSGRTGVGNGTAFFSVSQNNYPSGRSTQLTLNGDRGVTAAYRIEQLMPACSYVVTPDAFVITNTTPYTTETHLFLVDATPNDCQWTARTRAYDDPVWVVSGGSGQGDQQVTFRATWMASEPIDISVCGLSGQTPCAYVHVTWPAYR